MAVKRKAKRKVVTVKRRARRKAVTEGESVPDRGGSPSPGRVPMLDAANEMARRYETARRAAELNSDEYRAAVERFETARPTAARKPENPAEALAWLRTTAEHVRAKLEEYGAHKPPGPAVGLLYAQWLSDVRRLRWFADAVKVYGSEKNKKSLEQLLGLKPGRGKPVVQERRNKILEKLFQIALLRGDEGWQWKEIGLACSMNPQAARKLYERERQNLPEA